MSTKFFNTVSTEAYDESYSSSYDSESDINYIDSMTDSLSQAVESLNTTLKINKILTDNKENITPAAMQFSYLAVNKTINRALTADNQIKISQESMSLEGIVDNIVSFLRKIWDAVVKASAWIYEKIASLFRMVTKDYKSKKTTKSIDENIVKAKKEKEANPKTKENQKKESDLCNDLDLLNQLNCGFEEIDEDALLTLINNMEYNSKKTKSYVADMVIFYKMNLGEMLYTIVDDASSGLGLSSDDVTINLDNTYEKLTNILKSNFSEVSDKDSLMRSIIYHIDKKNPSNIPIHSNIFEMYANVFMGNMALTTIMVLRDKDDSNVRSNILTITDEYLGKENIPIKYVIKNSNRFLDSNQYLKVLERFKEANETIGKDMEETESYFKELEDYDKVQRKTVSELIEKLPSLVGNNDALADVYKEMTTGILNLINTIMSQLNNVVYKSSVYTIKSKEAIMKYVELRSKYSEQS